jgi:hypothetical protein
MIEQLQNHPEALKIERVGPGRVRVESKIAIYSDKMEVERINFIKRHPGAEFPEKEDKIGSYFIDFMISDDIKGEDLNAAIIDYLESAKADTNRFTKSLDMHEKEIKTRAKK